MTTGAPPPNFVFVSSKRIAPSWNVGPRTYNANGYVPHPLQLFGKPGGASSAASGPNDHPHHGPLPTIQPIFPHGDGAGSHAASLPPVAGATATGVRGFDYSMAHPHVFAINGKVPFNR